MTASHLRRKYFRIQIQDYVYDTIPRDHNIPVDNKELKELIENLKGIIKKDPDIQLFLSKTFYFHVGYGEMVKYKDNYLMKCFFPQNQVIEVSQFVIMHSYFSNFLVICKF